jgi:hypothetical protein
MIALTKILPLGNKALPKKEINARINTVVSNIITTHDPGRVQD